MFRYPEFDVEIVRKISPQGLRWPERGEAANGRNLSCNRSYTDLRGLTWKDVQRVLELETALVRRIEDAADPDAEHRQIEDELFEEDEGLFGLDIGVAGATVALAAARCITCSSCNAGSYGGHHHEAYPVVAFFGRPYHVKLLLACAERAQIGLECPNGIVVALAKDIRDMGQFAAILLACRGEFRAAERASKARLQSTTSVGPPSGLAAMGGALEFTFSGRVHRRRGSAAQTARRRGQPAKRP